MQVAARKLMMGLSAGMLLLSACGGSSDDGAGQLSEFQVSPADMGIQSPTTDCPGVDSSTIPPTAAPVKVGEVVVIGGTAPYVVHSAAPQALFFGPALATAPTHQGEYTVSNRNSRFSVFVAGCLDPGVITILDDQKRVQTVEVTSAASGAT